MTTETLTSQSSLLSKKLLPRITVGTIAVIAIMLLSLGLHLYNIESIGDANAYYTAAVKSMLMSWKNFFFVAAEPGGSVTVDKPPLGLWIEAAFAYFLGVSGFSVSLPNIIAGVLGIPLLYAMVKKYAGELAGIVAALVMAFTPVFVATNRNNTMDGLLVFFLLLAAWAFIRATETGKLRWVLVGAFIVGLGFNIKMLQAFLPLPAFYALYFFGSKEGWWRKIPNLGIASVLLVAVSLSWAVIVDLTPADQRPYIGSSGDNTVMGLITGHNGTSRLFGGFFGRNAPDGNQQDGQAPQDGQGNLPPQGQGQPPFGQSNGQTPPQSFGSAQDGSGNAGGPPQQALDACANQSLGDACAFNLPNGANITGICIQPLNSNQLACAPQGQDQANQQASNSQVPQGNAGGPPPQAINACANLTQNAACSFNLPNGNEITGTCITLPNLTELACTPQGMGPQNGQLPQNGQAAPDGPQGNQGGTPFSNETGSPGVFRFFTQPLSKQMSWLLPFALISIGLGLFASRVRFPLEAAHKSLLLWGGWLVTCLVFFSGISGIFHSYYTIMLAPALGAVVGMGFAQLWDWGRERKWIGYMLAAAAVITLAFQAFAFYQYGEPMVWIAAAAIVLLIGSVLMTQDKMRRVAYAVLLIAMLIAPFYWTTMTTASSADQNLPGAYQGTQQSGPGPARRPTDGGQPGSNVNTELVEYLEANTQGTEYLVAVPSSQQGSTMVLATGRPVLYMGGFGGQDEVVTADDLSQMVANGELKYILFGGGQGNKQEIANWLQTSCIVVPEFSQQNNQGNFQQGPGGNQGTTLYQCGK
ncbi:MAG: glycosyltransferase family 39 protein [Chloroflexota bacterium]